MLELARLYLLPYCAQNLVTKYSGPSLIRTALYQWVFGLVNLFGLAKWAWLLRLRPRSLHSQLRLMAATRASTSATALSFSIHSVVRGHHVYKNIWTPYVGEMLVLQREIGNVHDRFAVAVTAQPAATIVGRYGGAANSIFLAEDSVRDLPYFV